MPYPLQTTGQFTGSIQSGSYFNESDNGLFYREPTRDFWFGFSPYDLTEVAVYDYEDTQLAWGLVDNDVGFKTLTYSYENEKNEIVEYSYNQFISSFILYKNDQILDHITRHLVKLGMGNGEYRMVYNYVRFLAGGPDNPLSIKDISPSRKELKIIPTTEARVRFNAFCQKRFQIKDVSSLLLQLTDNCPYDDIYRRVKDQFQQQISFLQTIFFLPTDGDVLRFLRNLYEDMVKYVAMSQENIDAGESPDRVKRTQGIRTYFQNWMRSNNDSISDFSIIENKFIEFVVNRIDEQFTPYKAQTGVDYISTKQFLYDFFVTFFYKNVIDPLEESYANKYTSYLKNALDFGNNRYVLILNHSTMVENGENVLLVKLAEELPSDIKIKDRLWISNLGMVPYVFHVSVRGTISNRTVRISAPNFLIRPDDVSTKNINKLYSAEDLRQEASVSDNISVQKKITELNIDYSSFNNFVLFSSVVNRLNVFKNKVIEWTTLSSSLATLQTYSSSAYPYYTSEVEDLQGQMTDVVESFDGYEAYLFNGKNYTYNFNSETWVSESYVQELDDLASEYDRNNGDSLINNTPEYLIVEGGSDEYLTFLSMIGHYFDNLYLYIKSMPVERTVKNEISGSMSVGLLKDMLGSFGWKIDDILGDKSPDSVYLNNNSGGGNIMSDSERMQNIWNRILVTLPQLYKTKGTEECIRLILACHGIPTDLISVKEYGGIDYSTGTKVSHIQNEKVFMMHHTPTWCGWEIPFPFDSKTFEFKFSFDDATTYDFGEDIVLAGLLPGYWRIGAVRGRGQFDGHIYFTLSPSASYNQSQGYLGSSYPQLTITSSILPIFNGDIFSVMLRRNNPPDIFPTSSTFTIDDVPSKYDLYVQKNDSGRVVFKSTASAIVTRDYHYGFCASTLDRPTSLVVGNAAAKLTLGNNFIGNLDKIRLWRVPIDDLDFEDHVNDLNSYSWGSESIERPLYEQLYFISDVQYPIDMADPEYVTGSASGSFGLMFFPNYNEFYTGPTLWYTSQSVATGSNTSSIAWIPDNVDTSFRTGSTVLFDNGVWQSVSYSLAPNGCTYLTHSVYPYQYTVLNFNQTYTIGTYGPNKFKNNKIKKSEFELDVRLDNLYSSTTPTEKLISSDSNIFGFFSDPQDFRNKDTVRYFGNSGILPTLADPTNLYSSSYKDLITQRKAFAKSGNKKVLFNELVTLNKYYFDKSIFNTIKSVAPARANTLTGILIEPSIIERPKYQHKVISSSVQPDSNMMGVIGQIEGFSAECLWTEFSSKYTESITRAYPDDYYAYVSAKNHDPSLVEPLWYPVLKAAGEIVTYKGFEYLLDDYNRIIFNESMPPNYTAPIDLSAISNPNRIYPANIGHWASSFYVCDLMDKYQLGWYADAQGNLRTDSVIPYGPNPVGATRQKCMDECPSGSAIYYLMKRWRKYNLFSKSGSYVHDENPRDDWYSTSSVYLYDVIHVSEDFYKNLVYMTDPDPREVLDLSTTYEVGYGYHHFASTFISTSNDYRSNVKNYLIGGLGPEDLGYYLDDSDLGYFELLSGYPRNHYTHKMQWLSPAKFSIYSPTPTGSVFVKGRQTIDTTIDTGSLGDNSLPVTSIDVSNVNVVAGDNVLN